MAKKRFYIYASWEEMFDILSAEEKATMLMNLFKYQKGDEPVLNTSGLKIAWNGMKYLLEKDNENYQKKLNTMKDNAKANPKLGNKLPDIGSILPDIRSSIPDIRWLSDNDNDNDNDNVNGNDRWKMVNGRRVYDKRYVDEELG